MMGTPFLGDGTLASVKLEVVYTPRAKVALSATALAFNPTIPGELWVAMRQFPSGKACTATDMSGCAALQGVMGVVDDATGATSTGVIKEDGNSWHFMRRPTAVAWGDGELFASCGEGYTDNFENDPMPYAGPVLWSSDPTIFGVKPTAAQNGTHLDMMHESPYCMGIAHESANVYWAFNGDAGSLDRYDFHAPHQIGGSDHSDGEVYRYVAGQLLRVAEVPSHAAYDSKRKLVYVADTGHSRILSVDPSTATDAGTITLYEDLQGSGARDGATVVELVPPGLLEKPSGLVLANDVLFVTDNATSRIYTFDTAGMQLQMLDTGLPAGSLSGIVLGPDKKIYFTDMLTGSVHRIQAL
jgi:DNA-binding beta-propeller fold protein YncE